MSDRRLCLQHPRAAAIVGTMSGVDERVIPGLKGGSLLAPEGRCVRVNTYHS